jgi:uncharacterized protein (DUF58 family)
MNIFRKIKKLYKRFEKHFYSGPDWIDLPAFLIQNSSSYRSPTLLLIAWIYAYYVRILTIPGRMIISAVFLVFLYSMIIEGPIRMFAFILLGVLIVDFITGFIFRPKLIITRKTPERVRAGNQIKIDYIIKNMRNLPAWNLHLDPIHQQRWLKLEADIASIDSIKARQESTITAYLQSDKRGEYILKPSFASAAFPFGIIKWSCRNKNPQKIRVYPRFEPLNTLQLPVNSKFQREGVSLVSHVGESMEFHACRDFRTGDNAKHIHWPTTARKGELIVREFQEEYLCRIALIVDTFIPPKNKFFTIQEKNYFPNLEAALSLTAALSHHLAHGDYIVDIFAAGPSIYHFKGGRSLAQLDQILDILACIEANRKEPISKLEEAIVEEIASIGSAMLLLLNWDESRKKLVEQLQVYGVALKIIIITANSDKIKEIPDYATVYNADDILNGNVREI